MTINAATPAIAFSGAQRLAAGPLSDVARAVKAHTEQNPEATPLVLHAETSRVIDLDLRGTGDEVVARLLPSSAQEPVEPPRAGPGRPKLGVVSREVSLLPRHWDWLAAQPGGASVTLRRLVEEARRTGQEAERHRGAQEAAYRFLSVMGGNLPGFEEACRAFYAGAYDRFRTLIGEWPADVRAHVETLLTPLLPVPEAQS